MLVTNVRSILEAAQCPEDRRCHIDGEHNEVPNGESPMTVGYAEAILKGCDVKESGVNNRCLKQVLA